MQPTLFLITSTHRGWQRLRLTLQRCQDVHLVGEVQHADQAVLDVTRLQPAAILIDAEAPGCPLVALAQNLHAASPASKLMVLSDESALERPTLMALGPLIAAYLVWADLRAETVSHCLPVVVEDDLVVGSRAVREAHLAPVDRRQRSREQDVVLTARQRRILQGLAEGLKPVDIALLAYCSERTVDREIKTLQDILGACSEFTLGVKAARLGVVS